MKNLILLNEAKRILNVYLTVNRISGLSSSFMKDLEDWYNNTIFEDPYDLVALVAGSAYNSDLTREEVQELIEIYKPFIIIAEKNVLETDFVAEGLQLAALRTMINIWFIVMLILGAVYLTIINTISIPIIVLFIVNIIILAILKIYQEKRLTRFAKLAQKEDK